MLYSRRRPSQCGNNSLYGLMACELYFNSHCRSSGTATVRRWRSSHRGKLHCRAAARDLED